MSHLDAMRAVTNEACIVRLLGKIRENTALRIGNITLRKNHNTKL